MAEAISQQYQLTENLSDEMTILTQKVISNLLGVPINLKLNTTYEVLLTQGLALQCDLELESAPKRPYLQPGQMRSDDFTWIKRLKCTLKTAHTIEWVSFYMVHGYR